MNKLKILILTLLFCNTIFGQLRNELYKRKIENFSTTWHKITLPNDLFGKTAQDFSDIRIYGVTENDTIEAPYLLQTAVDKVTDATVFCKIGNSSYNEKGYYVTFEIPSKEDVNKMQLVFEQSNFDWKIILEGSDDQKEWFTIIDDYRILSIKNKQIDFKFTSVDLPVSNYRFYRAFIPGQQKPKLTSVKISNYIITKGTFIDFAVKQITSQENKKNRHTEITITLSQPVPVSSLKINCTNTFDYYRPITIEYVTDSVKTEKGWHYNYQELASGVLNSIEKKEFSSNSTILQKLKITIDNQDNHPLSIGSIEVEGYKHNLIVRFSEKAIYFLAYGNTQLSAPHYDIQQFIDKIPATISELKLEPEQIISHQPSAIERPLFENKMWLWIVMGLIILLLGGFSLSMMKKQ